MPARIDYPDQLPVSERRDDIAAAIDDQTACVVIQHPNFFGCLENLSPVVEAAHRVGALAVTSGRLDAALSFTVEPGRTTSSTMLPFPSRIGDLIV